MKTHHFAVSIENKVAQVAFDRPEKSNALHMEAWKEMQSVFEWLSEEDEARIIILRGEGKHFCAGIDLELLMSINQFQSITCTGRQRERIRSMIRTLQNAITAIERCAKPVLAAIHKGCIGAGVDIVTACDMRYCEKEAYFTVKEIDLGMVADVGTLQRLPKIISPGIAAEMAYTGRKVWGPEARDIGLVNHCYANQESLMKEVMELAKNIAAKSPLSIRGIKEILRYTRDHSVDDALNYMSTWNAAMMLSEDLTEAFKATMEKRMPDFKD